MLARAVDMMSAASDTAAVAEPAAPCTKAAFCTLSKPSIQGAAAVVRPQKAQAANAMRPRPSIAASEQTHMARPAAMLAVAAVAWAE